MHTINEKVYLSKQIIGVIVECILTTDQTVGRGIRDFLTYQHSIPVICRDDREKIPPPQRSRAQCRSSHSLNSGNAY